MSFPRSDTDVFRLAMIRLAIPTGVFRKSARTLVKGTAAPMANNRRDDYPALTGPFGYAGEGELLEATLRPRSKGLMLRGTGRTEIARPGKTLQTPDAPKATPALAARATTA